MLWTITIVLFILWVLGLVSSYTLGGWIHILLVLAVIVLIFNLLQGRWGSIPLVARSTAERAYAHPRIHFVAIRHGTGAGLRSRCSDRRQRGRTLHGISLLFFYSPPS